MFRIVVHPPAAAGVVTGVGAAIGAANTIDKVVEQPSRSGTYISLRLHCTLDAAESVLNAYDVIRNLEGVVMTL